MGWLVVDVFQLERLTVDDVLTSNHNIFLDLNLVRYTICIILPLRSSFVEFGKVVTKYVIYVRDTANYEDEALVYGNDCWLNSVDW